MAWHDESTAPASIHQIDFVGSTDPALDADNHVTAHKRWLDTSTSPYTQKIRNAANDAWITLFTASDYATAASARMKTVLACWGDGVNAPVAETKVLFPIDVASHVLGWQAFADAVVTAATWSVDYIAADGTVTDLTATGTKPNLTAARTGSDLDGTLDWAETALAAGGALLVTLTGTLTLGTATILGLRLWITED